MISMKSPGRPPERLIRTIGESRYFLTFILLIIFTITAMNAAPQNITDQQTRSKKDNSSIESLTSDIERLSKSADWWNNIYLVLVAVAVVVGGFTAYFQYTAVKKSRLLADVQAELGRLEKTQKDLQIAELNHKAAELNKVADDARERAGIANESAGRANERTAKLELEASEARRKQEELALATEAARAKAAELQRQNLAIQSSVEKERTKRLELAASLLPRTFIDQPHATDRLKVFSGMVATIEFTNDDEILSTAEQINCVLHDAKWKTTGVPRRVIFREGVRISPGHTIPAGVNIVDENTVRRVTESLRTLVEALNRGGIEAHEANESRDNPVGTLLIRVGRKPNRVLENAIRELSGTQPPTAGVVMSGCRYAFE